MAIDPKLVSIIPASQLPTGDPTNAADFLFYEGNSLKKGSMSNIYDKVTSGIKGVATQSNAPTVYTPEAYPNGLFETYMVRKPLTMPNSWGSAVTQAELDANYVFFDVRNGVVNKEVSLKPTVELAEIVNPSNITEATTGKAVADYIPKKLQSDNLLNLEGVVFDFYVPYTDVGSTYPDVIQPAEGRYTTKKIPIKPNTFYIKNALGSVCFFNSSNVMLSGYPNSTEEPILSDATASFAIFTGEISAMEKTVFVEGKNLIKPQIGSPTIDKNILPPSVLSRKGNNLIISKLGGGDFRHINDAIDWLKNSGENNKFNPFTFEIIDGNYIESVNIIGLYLSLIGRNRENCIIRTYTNDYYNPPIDMAGNNHLSNLTIIADDDGVTTPVDGVNGLPSYGIHFDVSSRYEHMGEKVQGRAVVKNCRIIGMNQHAVGQGLWTNTESIWDDCEFYSLNNTAFRSHSYMPSGATNQTFLMKNCTLNNPSNHPPIVVQDPNLAGGNDSFDTVYTFQNNIAWNDISPKNSNDLFSGHDLTGGGTLSGKIKLGKGSFGNNIPKLNI